MAGGWYFNPLTWQLLFMLGAIMAYAPAENPGPRVRRTMDVLSGIVIVFGLVMEFAVFPHPEITHHLPAQLARTLLSVDKTGLHPFRLISILSLVWVVSRTIPATPRWMQSRWARPFLLCGQHSLPVFCSGIFLSFMARLLMEEEEGWWVQVVVNVVGALLLVGVGALAAYYREKGRPVPKPLAGGGDPLTLTAFSMRLRDMSLPRALLLAATLALPCIANATAADRCAGPEDTGSNAAPLPHVAAVLKPGGTLDVLTVGSATVFSPVRNPAARHRHRPGARGSATPHAAATC